MADAIDKFFDGVEDILDLTIPSGRPGFAAISFQRDDKPVPTVLWHFALYKVGTLCEQPITTKQYHERLPQGGAFAFCAQCLRTCMQSLKDTGDYP